MCLVITPTTTWSLGAGKIPEKYGQVDFMAFQAEFLSWNPIFKDNSSNENLKSSYRIKIRSYTGLQILNRIVNVPGRINTGFILTGSINFSWVSLELRATIFVECIVTRPTRYIVIRLAWDLVFI